jgi:hypothetical protein
LSHTSKRRFWAMLRALGYETYGQYLASPHWADVRARFWAREKNRRCAGCRKPASEIHHKTYRRLGGEYLRDLVAVCHECHRDIHRSESYLPGRWGLFGATKVTLRRKRKGTFARLDAKARK